MFKIFLKSKLNKNHDRQFLSQQTTSLTAIGIKVFLFNFDIFFLSFLYFFTTNLLLI